MKTVLETIHRAFQLESSQEQKSQKLYFVLYEVIKGCILNSDIPSEVNLTPSRKLAEALDVSRSTVLKAYELLSLEGYIISYKGSGYIIKSSSTSALDELPEVKPNIKYPKLSKNGQSFMQNVGQLNTTDDKSIAFRPGLPPLDIFPVTQWKNLANSYWRYIKSSALSYSPASGNEQLKKSLAAYLNLSRGIKCDSAQVMIVSGSLQSLYLLGSVIMNPNDTCLVENPTFPNVKSIFTSLRTKMIGVDVDEEGIKVEAMNDRESKKAKLIHVTPSNHYPKGIRMSMQRRKELLDWAQKNNSFIIENDYEHEVNNFSNSLPSIFSQDKNQRTIFLGTFNRLLHPSIRVGYMVLPPYLIEAVEGLLKHSHRFVAPSIQVVLNQFIEKKMIYAHIKKVVHVADERSQVFKDAYKAHIGNKMPLKEQTVRSLHLHAELAEDFNDQDLCNQLAKKNILAHAVSKCYIGEAEKQGLIFGYSSVRSPVINRQVKKMGELL
ncbi:MAG: PLP-dependent aminotransferase family protein [Vicingaceae bacterium]